ncbi:NnrS family protein [Rhizobacter sp. P5_C2]
MSAPSASSFRPIRVAIPSPRAKPPAPRGWPLLRLGFRPFYLGAASAAVALMAAWFFVFTGRLALPGTLAPALWHAHEMIFGVVGAVVTGFLLTAGRLWTQLPTPRGGLLGALATLWLAARVAGLCAPYPVFFLLDVMLLPLVAALFADLIIRSRNVRNAGIALLLTLLGLANLGFHLAASGALQIDAMAPLHAGLALIVVLETVMGGRVIPAFTMNATPGLQVRASPLRDRIALVATAGGLALWVMAAAPRLAAALLAAAALLHAWRALSWAPWRTLRRPLLWVLHGAYAWIPIGLGLLAAALALGQSASPAIHALAIGATGGLVIGMITRTARGHTGRPLEPTRREAVAYALVMVAALLRVGVPLLWPAAYGPALLMAGGAWIAAFTLYLSLYLPWLCSPRLDGQDG